MAYYAAGTIIPSKLHLVQAQSKQHGIFRFLDLPGEIRNKVYDLVFDECLIEVRIGHQSRRHSEIVDRPYPLYPNRPQYQNDEKPQHERRRALERQPQHRDLETNSRADSKQVKRAPTLLQKPSPAVPQKSFKHRQQGRRGGKEGPSRLYHRVMPSSVAMEGETPTAYHVPIDFLFASRQIYNEALGVMYAKAVFRFTTTKAINRFLSITPLRALQVIQGLEISHATHAEPELTKNRKFKISADKNWLTTCKQMRDKMTDVKKLRLDLQLNDWPSQLSLQEEWAEPILLLRRNGLDRVDATLAHFAFSEDRLKEAARSLEMAMMSHEGRLAKDAQVKRMLEAKKEQKKKLMATKARKVLVIKMDNISATKKTEKV